MTAIRGPWSFRFLISVCVPLVLVVLGGCHSSPQDTHLTREDLDNVAAEMFASLQKADFVASRTTGSQPMVVVVQKVTNLTRDVMPEPEQWGIVNDVAAALNNTAVRTQRNISFTLPRERIEEAKKWDMYRQTAGDSRNATHYMDATFMTRTVNAGNDRTDLYYCEFRITDLSGGDLLWVDSAKFKHSSNGDSYR